MIAWFAGLAIGALFGFAWGWSAASKAVVITLPDTPAKGVERSKTPTASQSEGETDLPPISGI